MDIQTISDKTSPNIHGPWYPPYRHLKGELLKGDYIVFYRKSYSYGKWTEWLPDGCVSLSVNALYYSLGCDSKLLDKAFIGFGL